MSGHKAWEDLGTGEMWPEVFLPLSGWGSAPAEARSPPKTGPSGILGVTRLPPPMRTPPISSHTSQKASSTWQAGWHLLGKKPRGEDREGGHWTNAPTVAVTSFTLKLVPVLIPTRTSSPEKLRALPRAGGRRGLGRDASCQVQVWGGRTGTEPPGRKQPVPNEEQVHTKVAVSSP